MAVERAARWATPASSIYAAAAGDEQADLGVAGVRCWVFRAAELGAAATAAAFFRTQLSGARARVAWRGVAWRGVWRGVFLAPKPPWA